MSYRFKENKKGMKYSSWQERYELAREMKECFVAPLEVVGHEFKINQASLLVCFSSTMQVKNMRRI